MQASGNLHHGGLYHWLQWLFAPAAGGSALYPRIQPVAERNHRAAARALGAKYLLGRGVQHSGPGMGALRSKIRYVRDLLERRTVAEGE